MEKGGLFKEPVAGEVSGHITLDKRNDYSVNNELPDRVL